MRKPSLLKRDDLVVAKEGFPFIGSGLLVFLAGLWFQWWIFSLVIATVVFYLILFFRNPRRAVPEGERLVVSPADGRIVEIQELFEERFLKKKSVKISIFMNLFDVHVNRIPCQGLVQGIFYNPGKFISATRDKASLVNEQNAIVLETPKGHKILLIQIAGLIARRIVCWARVGDRVSRGDRFGIIRFGSRVDLFLPQGVELRVKLGEKVQGGASVVGVMHEGS
jgi:phosphatidylserine decarboxylase